MTFNNLNSDAILHEYEQLRLANRRTLSERKEAIYKEIPRIEEIDQTSSLSYLASIRSRLKGIDTDKSGIYSTSVDNRKLTAEKRMLLKQAGYPENYLDPIFACTKCGDMGAVDGEKCSCYVNKIIDKLYLESNLANILNKENFDTFSLEYYSDEIPSGMEQSSKDNITQILRRSKEFAEGFDTKKTERGNILIYGESGLGKTFLSNCIAKAVLDKGHSVLYLSAAELLDTVVGGYIMQNKSELETLYNYVYNCELLIIDDLGTEFTNNFVLTQLFEIINKRDLSGKSTLISTNLNMKNLRDRYTERVLSRIVANYTVFNIYGDNIRYQKRKKYINSQM